MSTALFKSKLCHEMSCLVSTTVQRYSIQNDRTEAFWKLEPANICPFCLSNKFYTKWFISLSSFVHWLIIPVMVDSMSNILWSWDFSSTQVNSSSQLLPFHSVTVEVFNCILMTYDGPAVLSQQSQESLTTFTLSTPAGVQTGQTTDAVMLLIWFAITVGLIRAPKCVLSAWVDFHHSVKHDLRVWFTVRQSRRHIYVLISIPSSSIWPGDHLQFPWCVVVLLLDTQENLLFC